MADNVLITQGAGTTIAADDIGGVLHQRVKLSQGADGSATDVSSASPLNVTLANTGANATPIVVDLGANNDVTVSGSVAVTGTFYQATQPVSAASLPLPTGASTETTLGTRLSESDFDTKVGSLTETAPATDTASSGLNGRLQRIAQRLTSLIALLPASLGAGGGIKVDGSGTALPVSGTFWQATQPISGTVTANAGTGTMAVSMATNTPVGNVAHDAADSGAPIKVGGRARTSDITSVANDDRVDAIFDKSGRQIMFPYCLPENIVSGSILTAMTGTTSTLLLAAPGAGLRNYITQITVSNAHGTVGTDLHLQDGSGGTAFWPLPAAAAYGGCSIKFDPPLPQPTTNTALYIVNVTTGASTKVGCVGFKGA